MTDKPPIEAEADAVTKISLNFPMALLTRLDVMAKRNHRSRTGQILHYITEGLERDGHTSVEDLTT
jgi:metal-responsive CopG/Arc/MetJ family transcriptional regulator